jgi:integrase
MDQNTNPSQDPEFLAFAAKAQNQSLAGMAESDPNITCVQVVDYYFSLSTQNLAASTVRSNKLILSYFLRDFGQRSAASCKPIDLLFWLSKRTGWKSACTRAGNIRVIRRPFSWAAKMGLIAKDPFAGVTCEEGEPRRAMTKKERQALLACSKPNFRRFLLFLWATGCRPGEAAALDWEQIDWDNSFAVQEKHKNRKRTRKPRRIFLSGVARKLLIWLFERSRKKTGPVFLNAWGRRYQKSSWVDTFVKARKMAGVDADCKVYGTRHAFCSNGVLAGGNITLLSTLVGNSPKVFARSYVHVDLEFEALLKAAENAGK